MAVALLNNPGGATLGGTLSVTAQSGVATFSGLTLDEPGTGYTLQVSSNGLTAATTEAFNVTSRPSTRSTHQRHGERVRDLGRLAVRHHRADVSPGQHRSTSASRVRSAGQRLARPRRGDDIDGPGAST